MPANHLVATFLQALLDETLENRAHSTGIHAALHRPGREAADDVALEEDEDQQHGECGEQRGRHADVEFVGVGGRDRPQADLDGSAFSGYRFPPEVIVLAVRWYLRYKLSYRDVAELLAERGIDLDHVTVWRWVQCFTPLLISVYGCSTCMHSEVHACWRPPVKVYPGPVIHPC